MKTLFTTIESALRQVKGIRYVDRDWGQLQVEQPAARFPCALYDVAQCDYQSSLGSAMQAVRATVEVLVAVMRIGTATNTSAEADEVIDAVGLTLHGLRAEGCTPLVRLSKAKEGSGKDWRLYRLTFSTSWREGSEER